MIGSFFHVAGVWFYSSIVKLVFQSLHGSPKRFFGRNARLKQSMVINGFYRSTIFISLELAEK